MHSKLQHIKESMADFQKTYPEDACLVLGDAEGTLVEYLPGDTIDIKVEVGSKIVDNTVTMRALRSGEFMREENGPELFGFPYISVAQPIFDDREVIGVLSALVSFEKVGVLRNGANDLAAAVQEMSASAEEMMEGADDVANRLQELSEQSEAIHHDITTINSILSLVKGVAQQSNILGLNASIEAARSGVHGRGFSVVAQEIRKMANNSNERVKEIEDQLEIIKKSVENMNESTSQIAAFTEEHNAGMQELSATYEKIRKTSEELMKASEVNHT